MDVQDTLALDMFPLSETGEKKSKVLHIYQIIRIFSNACEQKNKFQIEKLRSNYDFLQNIPALQNISGKILFASDERRKFRNDVITAILETACKECQNDNTDLLFFASAKFDLLTLKKAIAELQKDPITFLQNINQTRYSDSVMLFLLKYGNINNDDFFECMKILMDANIDINKFDIKGKMAIDYIATLYERNQRTQKLSEALKKLTELFLKKGIYKPENKKTLEFLTKIMNINIETITFKTMDDETKFFYCITKNKTDELFKIKNIKNFVNNDDGENTLLQIACKKTDAMLSIVQLLLKYGADPNAITPCNTLTPLELAALKNSQKIFQEILKNKNTEITQRHYNNFVRWRSQRMKTKLFELFLESEKLDPFFIYDNTGNTPLHYAIIFSHKNAIQNLLKRRASLIVKNKLHVYPLEIIDAIDLEKFFDSCLALDNYTPSYTDMNYKMRFNFNCLIDETTSTEVQVVSKIGKCANLEHFLNHPFIHTFVSLKWFRIRFYFYLILFLQALIFVALCVFFYRLPIASETEFWFCVAFVLINIILKLPIFLHFKIKNKYPVFVAFYQASVHACFEFFLIITTIGSFFHKQIRAFVFVQIAVSFLLTAGYHPKLSKWSLMLQQVFKTFMVLLMYFSLIIVSFSVGFHILFPDDVFFKNIFRAIFRTYIMTTGEFNIGDDTAKSADFGGYLIFLLFAMNVSLVIVNFWIGIAVTDIKGIEKNASKNVILFMLFIDYIYVGQYFAKIRNFIPNPLLFLRIDECGSIFHKPEKCEVDFYVNKKHQFNGKSGFPTRLDEACFKKIKGHYYKLAKVPAEREILTKLDEISTMMAENKKHKEYSGEN